MMKRFLTLNVLLAYFTLMTPDSWGGPHLIAEPPLSMQTTWNLANNGMLFIGYDTDHNGEMDFHTLRVVTTSYFSKHSVEEVAKNYPKNLIFFTNFSTTHYYYITLLQPLFYALDIDEDGHWDLIYKDPDQDGVNGNEAYYDSPSGMFNANNYKEEIFVASPAQTGK